MKGLWVACVSGLAVVTKWSLFWYLVQVEFAKPYQFMPVVFAQQRSILYMTGNGAVCLRIINVGFHDYKLSTSTILLSAYRPARFFLIVRSFSLSRFSLHRFGLNIQVESGFACHVLRLLTGGWKPDLAFVGTAMHCC
jgi:hypothetical protein